MTNSPIRLRQIVFASNDPENMDLLRTILDLGEPFIDPGVGEFGLTNNVFAFGDQFIEVVVPVEDNTAAGRFLARNDGLGGYMAIFQTPDLAGVRERADAHQIRRVWNIDLPDISASHLHPGDIGAAIVSIDEPRPPESWRWGGPHWAGRAVPGTVTGIRVTARDPEALARRWAGVLGIDPAHEGGNIVLPLAEGAVTITKGEADRVTHFHLESADPASVLDRARTAGLAAESDSFTIMGVTVVLGTR